MNVRRAHILACALALLAAFGAMDPMRAQTPDASLAEATLLIDTWQGDQAKLVRARRILEQLVASRPNDVLPRVELARAELYSGYISGEDYEEEAKARAERTLQQALALDPKSGAVHLALAELRRIDQHNDEALELLSKAQSLGADPISWQLSKARLHIQRVECDRAMPLFEDLVKRAGVRNSILMGANAGIAECGSTLKQYDKADAAFRRIIALDPQNAWSYGNYAIFLRVDRNDFDGAEANARRALSIRNYGAGRTALANTLYMKWGKALVEEKNAAKAQALFAQAQALNPDPGIVLRDAPFWPTIQPVVPALKQIGVSMDWGTEPRGGNPLLMRAVRQKNRALAEQLLSLGASVDARGFRNSTSLMFAARGGDASITNLLLARGADPTLEDDSGESAADWARDGGFKELALSLDKARLAASSGPAKVAPRDPAAPFRVGWTYRVKKDWKSHDRWAQQLRVGDELRYVRTYDWEATGERLFEFQAGSQARRWVAMPDQVSTWDEYFIEMGRTPR